MDSAKSPKVYRPKPLDSSGPTRRQFLQASAGALVGLVGLGKCTVFAKTADKVRRSRVALLENPRVVTDIGIRKTMLREMLEDGLCIALSKRTAAEAWHSLLKKDDRILLKFNRADADRLAISPTMATVLIESLMRAGFESSQIVPIEAAADTDADWAKDLPKPQWGWSEKEYDFGSGKEQLVKEAELATAIINIPFLKAHRIARMTGCLKNLSHGLIRRPALYHANQCCPYIPDIVNMPAIGGKLRLNIMNALRVVYDAQGDAIRDPVDVASTLLISTDPVATDTIGQGILDTIRREKGLMPITPELGLVQQHRLAAQKGLGTNNIEYIDVVRPVTM